jgi:hypothetical protein
VRHLCFSSRAKRARNKSAADALDASGVKTVLTSCRPHQGTINWAASNYYSAFSRSGKSVSQFGFANLIAPPSAKAGTLSVDAHLV